MARLRGVCNGPVNDFGGIAWNCIRVRSQRTVRTLNAGVVVVLLCRSGAAEPKEESLRQAVADKSFPATYIHRLT